jgi:hypothetical protein
MAARPDHVDRAASRYRLGALTQAFDDYQRELACRALNYELAEPSVAETPEPTLRLLADQVVRNTIRAPKRRLLRSGARPDEVLVCPITSPVWSVLFPRIGAW